MINRLDTLGNCLIKPAPALTKFEIYQLGSATSFNVKTLLTNQGISKPDSWYNGLTVNNFYAQSLSAVSRQTNNQVKPSVDFAVNKSYNSSTYVLTMSQTATGSSGTSSANANNVILVVEK